MTLEDLDPIVDRVGEANPAHELVHEAHAAGWGCCDAGRDAIAQVRTGENGPCALAWALAQSTLDSGFTGAEVLRILGLHSKRSLSFVFRDSQTPRYVRAGAFRVLFLLSARTEALTQGLDPQTIAKLEELVSDIRVQSREKNPKASEVVRAAISALHEARRFTDFSQLGRRGQWGSLNARNYLTDLQDIYLRALWGFGRDRFGG